MRLRLGLACFKREGEGGKGREERGRDGKRQEGEGEGKREERDGKLILVRSWNRAVDWLRPV